MPLLNPLTLDYKEPSIPVDDYMYREARFRMLTQSDEERAEMLLMQARQDAKARWQYYSQLAAMSYASEANQDKQED